MRDDRITRSCEWLRGALIVPSYGCSTGSRGRIPRQKPIALGSEKSIGYSARSLAWKSTGPAAMNLDLSDDEKAGADRAAGGTSRPFRALAAVAAILAKLATGLALSLSVTLCLLPSLAVAQGQEGSAAVEQKDIGRLSVQTQTYNQALGVVSELRRASAAQTVECNGTCYFPNSSKAIAWRCAPTKTCRLHCTVNPPAGGCD